MSTFRNHFTLVDSPSRIAPAPQTVRAMHSIENKEKEEETDPRKHLLIIDENTSGSSSNITLMTSSNSSEGEMGGLSVSSVRQTFRGPLLCDSLPEVRGDTSCTHDMPIVKLFVPFN